MTYLPVLALTASVSAFAATYLITKILIPYLTRKGMVVEDYHKPGKPRIPKLGGPGIITGILVGELILYAYSSNIGVLALIATTIISGFIGLVDDIHPLGGAAKPSLLVLAALPIILLGAYSPHPTFPIFHQSVRLTIIYPILVLIAIPVTANTVNTIDVFNGVVSSFTAIATTPLLIALLMKTDYTFAVAALPLIASSLAFYVFHRYPSKIFPGDSGTLCLGSAYGALAIIGKVEIVGVIALLPAILNSFFFLSSTRRLVEHREIKSRPTLILEDRRIAASSDPHAPITLVRMILAEGPLTEKEIVAVVLKLTVFSAVLAFVTGLTTWVV